ncbi:endonuclease/exonuclease/phosphatase family protein [Ulvibacterium marinum]|uniref:endonuclease/exonuclease/phosphatase family protein n=1 Tax=Ulvibacterium marinum TaxID=2419782 RepID=UPI002494DDDD|nr:endonuclease/exonuclease/phosphatase family protein [Ulvibacterium marinum]
MTKRLSLFNKVIFVFNAIFALTLLLVYLDFYGLLGRLPLVSFLNILVPFLIGVNVLFLVYWLILKKRAFLLSTIILLPGYFMFGEFIKLFDSNTIIDTQDISILTYNVHGFNGLKWGRDSVFGNEILDFLSEQDADIINFQEFGHLKGDVLDKYPYSYVNFHSLEEEKHVNQAIYSKYPIISKGSLNFPGSWNNAIYADIVISSDTIRVYNVHLQSLEFRLGSVKREEPQRLYKRLGRALAKQGDQARRLADHFKGTEHKKIVLGDFNNTQFSRIYSTLKGDFKDTFQEKGMGLGSTYNLRFLPFRIDFILVDPSFEVTAHKNYDVQLSDHEPIMASFRLKGEE